MPLTDTAVRNAKKREKASKLSDGRGLYLLVNSAGKYWRFDYRFAGKRKTLALGVYPDARRIHRTAIVQRSANSLEAVAREWHHSVRPGAVAGTMSRQLPSCVHASGVLAARELPRNKVVVAVARELSEFVWAIAREVKPAA